MLTLHGFSSSNYYNVAKLALLEKEIPFEESLVYTGADQNYRPEYVKMSPLGKVPCLETPDGFITESRCIVDYLERAHPERPLYPAGNFERAKMLELTQCIDLYLELPARRLLRNAFSRKPPPESVATEVRTAVESGARAIRSLARFDAFLFGDRFTAADIAGTLHFPVVRFLTKSVLDCDPLGDVPGLSAYLDRMEARPTVKRIRADRDANFPEFVAHLAKRYGFGP
jgi:glutathione S-transferase